MENKSETSANNKQVLTTSQAPTQSLKRESESAPKDLSTNKDTESLFVATAFTSATGEGEPLSLRTKMSLADYRSMLRQQLEDAQSAVSNNELSTEPDVQQTTTESAGKKIQTISITQPQTPALVNPAAVKAKVDQVVAKEVDDQDGEKFLQIPIREIHFVINSKQSNASKLKQFLANGESNLFKIMGNAINVVPAKQFSGKVAPVKLSVTTVNGDRHTVDYVTTILKPAIAYSADHQKDQVVFRAGNTDVPLKKANVQQVFFAKDGNNTTIINVTANGQTVGEAQIDPATGEINLVQLSGYTGQLDEITVLIYLKNNQVVKCSYQPVF
ncbi:hypothetical protein [Limosilactobacillus urinaemulieris]|uniref:hypothetical protein n=1 Tax=Limosilactobacillus urinaemulieris TaxID=2742600 RepID=UPI001F59A95E|nr:hypothetical protein [Limosilactobacillus urinaemulieris]